MQECRIFWKENEPYCRECGKCDPIGCVKDEYPFQDHKYEIFSPNLIRTTLRRGYFEFYHKRDFRKLINKKETI